MIKAGKMSKPEDLCEFDNLLWCASLTWRTPGTRMHYGKKTNMPRQCDALGNVLMVNLAIYVNVNLTHTTYLSIATDHVHF